MTHDPYKYFRAEARELIEKLGQDVLDLEKGATAPDLVARMLRHAHTLKGAARVVRQREIADDAHGIEDALAPLRTGSQGLARAQVDEVLGYLDTIGGRLEALDGPVEAEGTAPRAPAAETLDTVRVEVAELHELVEGLDETRSQLGALRQATATLASARHMADLLDDHVAGQSAARSIVAQLTGALGALDRSLGRSLEQIERELDQVRVRAERIQLVPARDVFLVLERAARDVAQSQGKRVRFEARNGELRLEARVLGEVQAALVQVVRNAVAHGIESPADRIVAGKPAEGNVRVQIERRGRRLAFVCRDDGRGFDLEAVRGTLQRKGMLSSEVMELGLDELVRLLLAGGISTATVVTEIAGRGIGLDVVREAARRLGGEVGASSEPGRGTAFELIVPESLASIDCLLVESGGVAATIPLDAVRRTMRIAVGTIARTGGRETVVCDGEVIPFMSLARCLSPKSAVEVDARAWSAVVVRGSAGMAALGVDRMLGRQSSVLRPLPKLAPASAVVAGATFDAQGNPRLALDPEGLVAEARRVFVTNVPPEARASAPILVIDDSLTTRMLERSILESAGYEVDVANCGEEALEKAAHKPYALFLVDIEMPGMDGCEFIERISAEPGLRSIPSILVSSRASEDDRRRGKAVGARAYIAKGEFDQSDLLGRIRALVG